MQVNFGAETIGTRRYFQSVDGLGEAIGKEVEIARKLEDAAADYQ